MRRQPAWPAWIFPRGAAYSLESLQMTTLRKLSMTTVAPLVRLTLRH